MLLHSGHDQVAILGQQAWHVLCAFFEAIPLVVFDPVMKGTTADAKGFGDLGFGEICVEVEALGLVLLFLFHVQ